MPEFFTDILDEAKSKLLKAGERLRSKVQEIQQTRPRPAPQPAIPSFTEAVRGPEPFTVARQRAGAQEFLPGETQGQAPKTRTWAEMKAVQPTRPSFEQRFAEKTTPFLSTGGKERLPMTPEARFVLEELPARALTALAQTPPGQKIFRTLGEMEEKSPGLTEAMLMSPFMAQTGLGTAVRGGIQALRYPVRTAAQRGVTAGTEKALKEALNTGLDKWIATQGIARQPETRNMLANLVVKDRDWLVIRARENLVKRLAEKRGEQVAIRNAVDDTIREIKGLPAFTPGGTAVPGQTRPLREVMVGAEASLGRGEMAKPMRVGGIDIKDIRVVPEKYQYRAGGEKGVDIKHVEKIVDEFNPDYFEPIQVNKVGNTYELLSGHHRLKAWETLQKRGNVPNQIPAIIHEVDEATAKEIARVANLGIKQYSPVEKIRVFSDAVKAEEVTGKSSEEALSAVAARYGAVKPREVENYLDASGLPDGILEWLDNPATSPNFKIEHAAVLARAAKKYNYDPVGLPAVVKKLVLEEGMTPGQLERALRTVGEKAQQSSMFAGQMFDFSQKGGILKDLADLNKISSSIEGERRTIVQFSNLIKERQKVGAATPETFIKAAKDAQGEINRLKVRLNELAQGLGKKMELPPEVSIREGVSVEYDNLIASLIGKNREDFLIVKETGPVGPAWVVRLKGSAPDEFIYRSTGPKQGAEEELYRLLVQIKEKRAGKPITPTQRIAPATPPGMPEAGVQAGFTVEGKPTSQIVRPTGKGQITQVSMEDQLKLAKARGEVPAVAQAPVAAAKESWISQELAKVTVETPAMKAARLERQLLRDILPKLSKAQQQELLLQPPEFRELFLRRFGGLTSRNRFKEDMVEARRLMEQRSELAPPGAPAVAKALVTPQAGEAPTLKQRKAMQWVVDEGIEDMSGKPIEVDKEGMVTLYHRTMPEDANQIYKTGNFVSKENTNETFFSNKPSGQAGGYGEAIVTVKVPVQQIRINDAFRDEIHVTVSNKVLSKKNLAGEVRMQAPTQAVTPPVAPVKLEVMRADPAGTAIKDITSGDIYWYDKTHGGWTIYGTKEKVPTELIPSLEQKLVELRTMKSAAPVAEAVPEAEAAKVAHIETRLTKTRQLTEADQFLRDMQFNEGMIDEAIKKRRPIPFVDYNGELTEAIPIAHGVSPEEYTNGIRVSIKGKIFVIEAEDLIKPIETQYQARLSRALSEAFTTNSPSKGYDISETLAKESLDHLGEVVKRSKDMGIELAVDWSRYEGWRPDVVRKIKGIVERSLGIARPPEGLPPIGDYFERSRFGTLIPEPTVTKLSLVTHPRLAKPDLLLPEGRWLPDVKSTDEIIKMSYNEDWMRKLGDWASQNKVGEKIAQVVGLAERSVIKAATVVRESVRADWESATMGAISKLRMFGDSKKLFNVDAEGRALIGDKQVALNLVLKRPGDYKLTPEQAQFASNLRKVYADMGTVLENEGIAIRKRVLDEGEYYIGTRVLGKIGEDGSLEVAEVVGRGRGGRVGAKASFEKALRFENPEDAFEAGFRYFSPEETVQFKVMEAGRKIADKRFTDIILESIPYRTGAAPEEIRLAKEFAAKKLGRATTLQAVTNRAIRGEKIPEASLKSIAASYPSEVTQLRSMLGDRKALRDFAQQAKALVGEARQSFRVANNAMSKALELSRSAHYGEGTIQAPAFAGKFFSAQDAKALNEALGMSAPGKIESIAQAISWLNAPFRQILTTFDTGVQFITLQGLIFYKPQVWAKATARGFQALFTEQGYQKFLATHLSTIQKWSPHGAIFTPSEFTESSRAGGALARIPGVRRVARLFGRYFEAELNAAKAYGLEASESQVKTAADYVPLASFWNDITGVTNTARKGLSSTQRAIETAVAFAPRYRRATASVFTSIGRGDIRGAQAREALGKLILGGTLAYIGIAKAMGQEPILDPREKGRWMTVEIAGQRVGMGGAIAMSMRLAGQLVLDPTHAHEYALTYAKGLAAPVPGMGITIQERPFLLDKPLQLTKEVIAKNLVPIWAGGVLLRGQGSTWQGKTTLMGGEFLGGRVNPITPGSFSQDWQVGWKEYEALPEDPPGPVTQQTVRRRYLIAHPEIAAQLFIAGKKDSLISPAAATLAYGLIIKNKINPDEVKGIKKRKAEIEKRKQRGEAPGWTNTDMLIRRLAQKGEAATQEPIETLPPPRGSSGRKQTIKKMPFKKRR